MSLKHEPGQVFALRLRPNGSETNWLVSLSAQVFFSSLLLSSLELSDTQVYEPQTRALLGTASHFCEVVVLKLIK